MTKLATHHMPARAELKRVVFPTAHWEPAPSGSKGVDPRDAPRGTLRGELAHLMISLDSNVKRCAAEFLYVLCNEDGQLVVRSHVSLSIYPLPCQLCSYLNFSWHNSIFI